MIFSSFLKTYLTSLLVFLGIDSLWLGVIARGFYQVQLAAFERTINLKAGLLVYFLIPLGISLFVLPRVSPSEPAQVFGLGALYGLVLYGVYDLTNLATLADWPLKMVMVDMLWGMVVCGLTSLIVAGLLKQG